MRILGPPTASAHTIAANLRRLGASDLFTGTMVPALWTAAREHGIDPVVMVAQSANETGWGRWPPPAVIDASYRNTCGLKTRAGGPNDDPAAHARFPDWATGARAHAQHLLAYCQVMPSTPLVDPRFGWVYGQRAAVLAVEQLGGAWSTEPDYGHRLVRLAAELTKGAPMTDFVSRAKWGHHGGYGGYAMAGDVPYVVCHHTPGQEPTTYDEALEELHQVLAGHLAQNWGNIGYTWLVWDRYAFEGRGWGRTGAHAPGANSQSIGIAFLLDGRNRAPTPTEWNTAADICHVGVSDGYLAGDFLTTGHRDWVATACPSELVYFNLGDLRAAYGNPLTEQSRRVTVYSATRIDVVVAGADGELYHQWYDMAAAKWSGFGSIGGSTVDAPAVVWAGDWLNVYVRGADDQLWQRRYHPDHGWIEWEPLGGQLTSGPAAAAHYKATTTEG